VKEEAHEKGKVILTTGKRPPKRAVSNHGNHIKTRTLGGKSASKWRRVGKGS